MNSLFNITPIESLAKHLLSFNISFGNPEKFKYDDDLPEDQKILYYNGYDSSSAYNDFLGLEFNDAKSVIRDYIIQFKDYENLQSYLKTLKTQLLKVTDDFVQLKKMVSSGKRKGDLLPFIIEFLETNKGFISVQVQSPEKINASDIHDFIKIHESYLDLLIKEVLQIIPDESWVKNIKAPKVSKAIKPDLSENQLLLLLSYMRDQKLIHPETSSEAVALALHYLSGYAQSQMRKNLPGPSSRKGIDEVSKLYSDYQYLVERLDQLKTAIDAESQGLYNKGIIK